MRDIPFNLSIIIVLCSFLLEGIDSSLGMGYGTSLTPILLAFNFEPADVVPAVLLSELFTGIFASFFHHKKGNVNLFPNLQGLYLPDALKKIHTKDGILKARKRTPRDLKVGVVLAAASVIGAVTASSIAALLPADSIKLYIGVMVIIIGLVIIFRRSREASFSWKRIVALGGIAVFNKGISGGGYGPIITSGQMLSGVDAKSAIAISSFSEITASAAGLLTFFILGKDIFSPLVLLLLIGSLLSAPLSAHIVSKVHKQHIISYIGLITIALGSYTLIQAL